MVNASIILPTFDRNQALSHCLQALERQNYPRESFEVIVVNDGGNQDAVNKVVQETSLNTRVIHQPQNRGPAAARNTGVLHSKGTFLIFTDDDCCPSPEWVSAAVKHLSGHQIAITGPVINGLEENPFSSASQGLVNFLYQYHRKDQWVDFITSNNFGITRKELESVGGFDEAFPKAAAEDRDLCERLLSKGRRIQYCDEMRVSHFHDLKLRSFFSQHYQYGRGAFLFHSRRSERKQKSESGGGSLHLTLSILFHQNEKTNLRDKSTYQSLIFLSQVANVMGRTTATIENLRKRLV